MTSPKFNGSHNGGQLGKIDNNEEENEIMILNHDTLGTNRPFQRPCPGPDVQPVPARASAYGRTRSVSDRKIRRGTR